jgi:hypothetical protein
MNNFVEGLKNQIITFCIVCADSSKKCCLVMKKKKDKFWLAFMKTLTNCENSSRNLLQIACGSIQEACDSVNCSVSHR